MKKYWIIGHPLSFCLTTPVMNGAFKELNIDAAFETHDIDPADLPDVMEKIRKEELAGCIATMPFKTPSLEYLDSPAPEVTAINAVNLILNENGKLVGYNTDWLGAMGAIQAILPDLVGKKILILGAGGAARAACYGLKKEGAQVFVWNRTLEKAQRFAENMGAQVVENCDQWNEEPDIIINATAHSNEDRQTTLVPFRLWQKAQLALDAVYGKTSLFLEAAQAAQVPYIISGEVWFLKQVIPLFEHITGRKAPVELMSRLTAEAQDIQKL